MFDFDADAYDGDIFDLDIGRLNQMADFVVTIGDMNRGKEPENLLETKEANEALDKAYRYAREKQDSSIYALNAKVYIEAIEENRKYGSTVDFHSADVTQLLYILENLRYWRGDEAKKSKQILKDYIDERKGY